MVWRPRFLVLMFALLIAATAAFAADEFAQAEAIRARLPDGERRATLLASLSQEGHWTLRNSAGETMTAATPDELSRAIATVSTGATRLLLTADTIARLRSAPLPRLERLDSLAVAHGTDQKKLIRVDATGPVYFVYRPRLLVVVASADDLELAEQTLARKLTAPPRALRIMPGGPEQLNSSLTWEGHTTPPDNQADSTRRHRVDAVDPIHLRAALQGIPRQTVLLTGRLDQDKLLTSSGGGRPDAVLDIPPLAAVTRDRDVAVLVLSATSAAQPETPSWLIRPSEIPGWRSYLKSGDRRTFGELIETLMDPADNPRLPLAVSIKRAGDGSHTELSVKPFSGLAPESVPRSLARTVADWGRTLSGRAPAIELRAYVPTPTRSTELDRRLLGWLPSTLQRVWLGLYGLGLFGLPVAWRWWQRLWPNESVRDYASGTGYWLAEGVRRFAFGIAFLPLAGIASAPTRLFEILRARTAKPH